jgi:hypothetical protein
VSASAAHGPPCLVSVSALSMESTSVHAASPTNNAASCVKRTPVGGFECREKETKRAKKPTCKKPEGYLKSVHETVGYKTRQRFVVLYFEKTLYALKWFAGDAEDGGILLDKLLKERAQRQGEVCGGISAFGAKFLSARGGTSSALRDALGEKCWYFSQQEGNLVQILDKLLEWFATASIAVTVTRQELTPCEVRAFTIEQKVRRGTLDVDSVESLL